jgi:peptidoglycan hydrolase FlgJ
MATSLRLPALPSNGFSAAPNTSGAQPDRLHKAAQEFEALLVGEMLKSARESGSYGWLGSGEGTGDDSAMYMAESQLANALTSSGGLGLAASIERSMSKRLDQKSAETPLSAAKPSSKEP